MQERVGNVGDSLLGSSSAQLNSLWKEPFVVDDGINHWPDPSSKLFPQAVDSEYPCSGLIAGKTLLFSEH